MISAAPPKTADRRSRRQQTNAQAAAGLNPRQKKRRTHRVMARPSAGVFGETRPGVGFRFGDILGAANSMISASALRASYGLAGAGFGPPKSNCTLGGVSAPSLAAK